MTDNHLQQINISYQPVEDRLLLRLSTRDPLTETSSEICMWLTRRFVQLLWNLFEKLFEEEINQMPQTTQTNKQIIKHLQQQSDLAQSNFSTPYSPPESSPANPVGKNPLLLTKIKVKENPNGNKYLYLGGEQSEGIHLKLTTQLMSSLMKLLGDTTKKANWDLPFTALTEVQENHPFRHKLI